MTVFSNNVVICSIFIIVGPKIKMPGHTYSLANWFEFFANEKLIWLIKFES